MNKSLQEAAFPPWQALPRRSPRAAPLYLAGTLVERINSNREFLHLGSPALVHALLDLIVDGYFETVQELDDAKVNEDLEYYSVIRAIRAVELSAH